MQKFVVNVLWFLLLPAFLTGLLYFLPINKKYAYTFLDKGGCPGRSTWIYDRIFCDTTEIDVAFLGTSHTMNAINESLINQSLLTDGSKPIHCLNLAYCDFGRNMDYVIAKDLLAKHKVKTLFLEVRENEAQVGHKQFAFLADGKDVIGAPIYFNRSYFPDLYKSLLMRLQFIRETVTSEDEARAVTVLNTHFGYNPSFGSANLDDLKNEAEKANDKSPQSAATNPLNYAPMNYVQKISALCKASGVKLYLHYLPQYGYSDGRYWLGDNYNALGLGVFMMQKDFYEAPQNWYDAGHLNDQAANNYSTEIAKFIQEQKITQ